MTSNDSTEQTSMRDPDAPMPSQPHTDPSGSSGPSRPYPWWSPGRFFGALLIAIAGSLVATWLYATLNH